MDFEAALKVTGMIAGVLMPLFNIPLVYKICKRKSSSDISITWAAGVWSTILLMTPSAIMSVDPVFRIFGIANLILFSFVFFAVLRFR